MHEAKAKEEEKEEKAKENEELMEAQCIKCKNDENYYNHENQLCNELDCLYNEEGEDQWNNIIKARQQSKKDLNIYLESVEDKIKAKRPTALDNAVSRAKEEANKADEDDDDIFAAERSDRNLKSTTDYVDLYKSTNCNVIFIHSNTKPEIFCLENFCKSGLVKQDILDQIRTGLKKDDMYEVWEKAVYTTCRSKLPGLNSSYAKQSFNKSDLILMIWDSEIEASNSTCAYAAIDFKQCYLYIDVICAQYGVGGILLDLIDKIANYLGYDEIRLESVETAFQAYMFKGYRPLRGDNAFTIPSSLQNFKTLFKRKPQILEYLVTNNMITQEEFEGEPVKELKNVNSVDLLEMQKIIPLKDNNKEVYDFVKEQAQTWIAAKKKENPSEPICIADIMKYIDFPKVKKEAEGN